MNICADAPVRQRAAATALGKCMLALGIGDLLL
jgi:hypothetical protein